MGVVVRRYIDFLILLIPTPLVSVIFYSSIPTFLFIFLIIYHVHDLGEGSWSIKNSTVQTNFGF